MSFILIFKLLKLLLESKSIYSRPTVFVRGLRNALIHCFSVLYETEIKQQKG